MQMLFSIRIQQEYLLRFVLFPVIFCLWVCARTFFGFRMITAQIYPIVPDTVN